MSATNKIPVTVLTGFLGSGKTTLLNRLLADAPKTAVIINEFGSTPVDQALLQQTGMPLTMLAGGCLCCQIKGTLTPTLKNLWMAWSATAEKPFERIIIETSGVASPEPILDTLLRERWVSGHYRLQQVLTTLAIPSAIEQLERFAEARAQVVWADVLLLTQGDLADAEQNAQLSRYLQTIAPVTPLFPVTRGDVDISALQNSAALGFRSLPAETVLTEHSFRSVSVFLDKIPLWWSLQASLQGLLERHPLTLLRVKGVVFADDCSEPQAVHAVAGRLYPSSPLAIRAIDDQNSRLVFIGHADMDAVVADLIGLFGKKAVR